MQAARRGYAVAVGYATNAAAADDVVHRIEQTGGTAVAVRADVAHEEQVLAMFATVDDRPGRLTALVNNAGMVDVGARLEQMTVARMRRMVDTNVIGSLVCAREAVVRMSARHGGTGGVIVDLSSAAARLGGAATYVDYAASKGAIDTLTVGLAQEVAADGIRVVGVRPGLIDTDIHASSGNPDRARELAPTVPLGRTGSADEVAHAIVWLMSDQASYVTGTTLDVTGGR